MTLLLLISIPAKLVDNHRQNDHSADGHELPKRQYA